VVQHIFKYFVCDLILYRRWSSGHECPAGQWSFIGKHCQS